MSLNQNPVLSLNLNPVLSLNQNTVLSLNLNPVLSLNLNPVLSLNLNPVLSPYLNPVLSLNLNPVLSLNLNTVLSLNLNPTKHRCYLFDDSAKLITDPDFLTADSLDESKYKSLSVGQKEGEVMKDLIYKHKFFGRTEAIDFQGVCHISPYAPKVWS